MYSNISLVYSSHSGEVEDKKFEKMLYMTSGLLNDQLEILRYENFNQFPLTEVYNIGLKESKHLIVLFIHNDTRFVKEGWGTVLLDKFNSGEFGVLGLAGTNKMLREHCGQWFRYAGHNAGFVYHPGRKGDMQETWFSNKLSFIVPAVAIDGVFMAIAKDRTAMGFDEDFKGFHFYDISFCIRNFENGVKIGIISDLSIALYHNSVGYYGAEWNKNRLLFLNKYKGNYSAPTVIDIPETRLDIEKIPQQNRIHIIILTKNKNDLLFQCLDSIVERTAYPLYTVWIADTGSDIENKESIRIKINDLNERALNKYEGQNIGSNQFNLLEYNYYHFSMVNNEVIKTLENADYIKENDFLLFCNNDIKLLNDCISGCIDTYQRKELEGANIGTIGIRLHFADNTIQHSGLMFSNVNNYVHIVHKYYHSSYYYANKTEECLGNTGAFMFTPYRTFKELGMFNEKYMEIYQDAEYNLSCVTRGYTNLIAGNLVAYHYESQTRNQDTSKEFYSSKDRNNVFFPYVIKNHRSFRKYLNKPVIKENYQNNTENSSIQNKEENIQLNSSVWLPLLSGNEKQKIEGYLNKIEMIISQNIAQTNTLGLFAGQSGISLYLFNYFKLTHNTNSEDLAYEILESIAGKVKETSNNHSFVDGLCGIGWFIEYLAQNQFIENNTADLLSEIDELYKNSIFNLLNFSLANGMISYGMYFLSRITNPDNKSLSQKEILVHLVNYLDCFLPEDISESNEPENLTLLQGYMAVIPFLCQTYKAIINNFTVLRIVEKYVKFILQFERQQSTALRFPNQIHKGTCLLQWDCGDLAVANVLLQAAKISNNKEWESKALEIALRTTLVKEIESPAMSTINGTAGITHLYNRLYQHYHLPELKEAAIYWLDKTLGILETQKNVSTDNGIINGLAGTGLVLMAAISEAEPKWDSALLMN